jgi:hypothetical protein
MTKGVVLLAVALATVPRAASANVAGGDAGQGPDVTVVDHRDGTVTLANGLVAIVIDTAKARLDRVTYTHRNDGRARDSEVLLPGGRGGATTTTAGSPSAAARSRTRWRPTRPPTAGRTPT